MLCACVPAYVLQEEIRETLQRHARSEAHRRHQIMQRINEDNRRYVLLCVVASERASEHYVVVIVTFYILYR